MTVLFRSFVVWLLLLALPYQGYAAAEMLLCVAPATASMNMNMNKNMNMAMPSGAHDHAAMMASQAKPEQGTHQSRGDTSSSHASMKCNGSACCAAVAPVLALQLAEPALPSASHVIPFYADFLPAVDLAHPERPPQGNFA
jgi:hypothetical protein